MPDKEDQLATAQISVALVGELIKAAGNDPAVKEAAGNLGQAAVTISRTINNALLPLAAVNFAFDKARIYFEGKFQTDLSEKAARIPLENVQEPKASIAGPALQALAFTHDEPSLRDMFLGLLATSMDSRKADLAHPAFVEIIKQLDASEAPYLKDLLRTKGFGEIASVDKKSTNIGKENLCRHLVDMHNLTTGEPVLLPRFPAMLDNWARLGLIEIHYDAWLTRDGAYDWVEQRPEYIALKAKHDTPETPVSFKKGYFRLTNLGEEFARAVESDSI